MMSHGVCALSRGGVSSVCGVSNSTFKYYLSYYYPKLASASENENAAIDEALLSVVVVVCSS